MLRLPTAGLSRLGPLPSWLLGVAPVLFAAAVFYPITHNYFFGDDLLNLYRIVNWGFARYVLTPYAGHILVVRNALFYFCFQLFGPQPQYFFYLVLLTHLLNVLLLFRVIATFTGSARLACFGAALWGVSPINEGTLGWYSVYGQVLAATTLLWLLARFGRVARGEPVTTGALLVWVIVAIASSTLFGTGTGVALALPIAAYLLLPAAPARTRVVLAMTIAAGAVPLLYYGLHRLAFALHWGMPVGSLDRLLANWPELVDLFCRLLAYGSGSLLLGGFGAQVDLAGFATRVILLLFVALLATAGVTAGSAARRLLLACAVLAAAAYVMIVLGRGPMVSAGLAAVRIYSATRYHYLGPIPLTIALCAALSAVGQRWPLPSAARDALLVAWLALALGLRLHTGVATDHHELARQQTQQAVQRLRRTIDAAPAGQDLFIRLPSEPFLGIGPMLVGKPHLFPGLAGVFAVFFTDDVVDGRRVRFVTSDQRLLNAAPDGQRSAELFVSPAGVPAAHPVVVP